MKRLAVLLVFVLYPLCAWADTAPRYKAIPSLGWSRDRVVDLTSAGTITGETVALTGTICSGTDKLTTDSSGNVICATDQAGGGAGSAWDTIADPSADGSVSLAGFKSDWTSTLDAASGYIFRITDTDAVRANTMTHLELDDNDGANVKVQYLKFVGDADGIPTTDFLMTQTLTTFGMPVDMNAKIISNIGNTGTDFIATTGALTLAGVLTANGGITLPDGQLLNLSNINDSATTEGLTLPQAVNPTTGTAEGQIGWDTDDDELHIGTGTATIKIGKFLIGASTITGQTASHEMIVFGTNEAATAVGGLPIAMTCKGMTASVSVAPDNGAGVQSWTVSVAVNGTAGAISTVISETQVQNSDLSNSMSFAAGDKIEFQWVAANTPTSSDDESVILACYPD